MAKKLIAFDLDRTLTDNRSLIDGRMAGLLDRLLDKFQVCVISGGGFKRFDKQLLAGLTTDPDKLGRLHLMPACGTRYHVYDPAAHNWRQVYAEDLTDEQKQKITAALNKGFDDLGYRGGEVYGDCIDDRGSQVTFSALGQDIVETLGAEGIRRRDAWDPDNKKKTELRDYIAALLPEFEVRTGGVTSIDVTKPGIDKAYGMKKLMEILKIDQADILFIGDRMQEGGNDYPVKAMGIDCLQISRWQDTAAVVGDILKQA